MIFTIKKFYKQDRDKNKGFLILFAIVLSSIILAVALGVSNMAYNQISFGTSARHGNEAFFAADTGVECALYYELAAGSQSYFGIPEGELARCSGEIVDISAPGANWTFVVSSLGEGDRSCAIVSVEKTTDPDETHISSKGYNTGGNTSDCTSADPRRVEREILVRLDSRGVIVEPEPEPEPGFYTLSVALSGTGSGSVSSNPAGISCGGDCTEQYSVNDPVQTVQLIQAASSGSTFAGFSGDADCSDGTVTMNANVSCTASFTANVAVPEFTLTVGKDNPTFGIVTSTPAGINCGSGCPSQSADFPENQTITLNADAINGGVFVNWYGDTNNSTGCQNSTNPICSFTLDADDSINASFEEDVPEFPEIINLSNPSQGGSGPGRLNNHPIVFSSTSNPTQNGELLVTFVSMDLTACPTATQIIWTSPGWTSLFSECQSTSGATFNYFAVYYKTATGNQPSGQIQTIPGTSHLAYRTYRITGFDSSVSPQYALTTGSSLQPDSPLLDPTWSATPTLWISALGLNTGGQFSPSVSLYPSNYNDGARNGSQGGGGGGTAVATSWRSTQASFENPGPHTLSATDFWIAVTVGIKGQ